MPSYKTRDPSRGLVPAEPVNQPAFFHSLNQLYRQGRAENFYELSTGALAVDFDP